MAKRKVGKRSRIEVPPNKQAMESIEQSVEQVVTAQLEIVLEALKDLACEDLFVVVKAATQALEKATKLIAKAAPKAGSAPKGVQPPQLARPRKWVEATLQHALANGWEKFVARKGKEEIEYPASVEHEGAWIFPDSIDEKNPNGKQILMTHAMSLSKQRWSVKLNKGSRKDLYEQFLAAELDSQPSTAASSSASSIASSRSASPAIVRKTAAEKAAELAEAKRVKEEEKAAAKAVKDAEKAEAKRVKELEKAEEKRVKDEAKAAAKAAKEAEKPTKSPKAAVVKAVVVKALVKAAVKPAAAVAAATTPSASLESWKAPTDGSVSPWVSNGIKYLRNSDNQLWLDGGDDLGAWQGVLDVATGKIDTSVPEPSFDDEE